MPALENASGTNVAEIDTAFKSLRTSIRPMEVTSWLDVAAASAALTGVAANAAVFSFRNISTNPVIVRRVGVGFICTTGFTAAQSLLWGLKVARAFSASDIGGTAVALAANNCKARTSLGALTSNDCRIASTGALAAGTKTLDTNDMGITGAYALAATAGVLLAPSPNNLLQHDSGDYPLVLAQNEGFNVMNLVAMGAGGVGTLIVNMEVAEAATF